MARRIKSELLTGYLQPIYDRARFRKLIPRAIKLLEKIQKERPFKAIAFRGSSGAALAYPLSYLLNISLMHVRKKDGNHFPGAVEGVICDKYIIIDDFIESGKTVKEIVKEINKAHSWLYSSENQIKPQAIILYTRDVIPIKTKNKLWKDVPVYRV